MKLKSIYSLLLMALLATLGCDPAENKEDNGQDPKGKNYEREIVFGAYETDTILTVSEFTSAIKNIENNTDWLFVRIDDSSADAYKLRVICLKNTTAQTRSAQIEVSSNDNDLLTLKVTQYVLNGFEDLHNNVSDQPALAPGR